MVSPSRNNTLPIASQLIPSSSSTSALARRASRCAAPPSRASSIRSRRDSLSRKRGRIMGGRESTPRGFARGIFRIFVESGYNKDNSRHRQGIRHTDDRRENDDHPRSHGIGQQQNDQQDRTQHLHRLIPGALYFNLCIDAFGNGDEDVGQPHESVPCVTAPIDDSLIVLINNVAELITSEVLPEILYRVEFRSIGRQAQQHDVLRYFESRRAV